MTDDRTEFQQDRTLLETATLAPSGGPSRKWYYQRIGAWLSMCCICWWPIIRSYAPEAGEYQTEWFLFHGGIFGGWMGITHLSARR